MKVSTPRKRAAIVLDKLMFALQKALDDSPAAPPGQPAPYSRPRTYAAGPCRATGLTLLKGEPGVSFTI
ncbi:putative allatostatin CC-like [Homarus americanus]|uniref:Putative allatostatin CC-like n=1 Tax=Homarus americanus TaxID=6706 RepID=A0A8J5MS51_HOMAM|nr:putative allatostatin CC-like [Homarus americanus]